MKKIFILILVFVGFLNSKVCYSQYRNIVFQELLNTNRAKVETSISLIGYKYSKTEPLDKNSLGYWVMYEDTYKGDAIQIAYTEFGICKFIVLGTKNEDFMAKFFLNIESNNGYKTIDSKLVEKVRTITYENLYYHIIVQISKDELGIYHFVLSFANKLN